jgi:hypothetical protein
MGRKLSLKDKIVKMYKKNDTAGLIYMTFVKGKDDKEKKEAIDIFIELAKIDNKDKLLRSKALVMLGFFKDMCCHDKVEEFYKDGSIICGYQNIPHLIEENTKELISELESSKRIDLKEDKELCGITTAIIHCLHSYQVNPKIAIRFFDLMEDVDSYIDGQILRLRPKYKI